MNLYLPIFLFFGVVCALCALSDALTNTRTARYDPRRSRLLALRRNALARSALRARRPTSGSRRGSQVRVASTRRRGINAATSIKNTKNQDTKHIKQTIIIAKTANIMSPIGTQNNDKTAISSRGRGGVQNSSPPKNLQISSTRQRALLARNRRPQRQNNSRRSSTAPGTGRRNNGNGRVGPSGGRGLASPTSSNFGLGNRHSGSSGLAGNRGRQRGHIGAHGGPLSGQGGSLGGNGGSFGGNGGPMGGHGGSFGGQGGLTGGHGGPMGGHGGSFGGNGGSLGGQGGSTGGHGGSMGGHGGSFGGNGGSLGGQGGSTGGHGGSTGGHGGPLGGHGGSFGGNGGSLGGQGGSTGGHGGSTGAHGGSTGAHGGSTGAHGGSTGGHGGPMGGHGGSFGGQGSSTNGHGGSMGGHAGSFGGQGGSTGGHGGTTSAHGGSMGSQGANTGGQGVGSVSARGNHASPHNNFRHTQNNAGHSGSNFNLADMLLSGLGVASSSPNLLAMLSTGLGGSGGMTGLSGGGGMANGLASNGGGLPDVTGLFRGPDGARLLNSLVQNVMGPSSSGMGVNAPSVAAGHTLTGSHGGSGTPMGHTAHGSTITTGGRHAPIIIEAGSNVQVGFRHGNGNPSIVIKAVPTTTTPATFLASATETSLTSLAMELGEELP